MNRLMLMLVLLFPGIALSANSTWVEPTEEPKPASARVVNKVTPVVAAKSEEQLPIYYGQGLCTTASELFECVKVPKSQSWEAMFPDENQRDLVQRVNRNYNYLWQGKVIAVPRDLAHMTVLDLSPFPQNIQSEHEKQVIIDQDKLAWAAYDAKGQLVNWGPIASGRDKCPDSNKACKTLTGIYRVFSKENEKCRSDIFPIGKGARPCLFVCIFIKDLLCMGQVICLDIVPVTVVFACLPAMLNG